MSNDVIKTEAGARTKVCNQKVAGAEKLGFGRPITASP